MGVVRKQGILSLIATIAGFAIGAVNTFLYNEYLDQDEYGLTGIFREVFIMFSYIATLGSAITFHRFYPLYSHHLSRERNDLPFLVLAACTLGLAIVSSVLIAFKVPITAHFSENAPLFVDKYYLVLPLTATCMCTVLLEAYSYMLKRTVAFNLVKEMGFRVYQTIIIFLYAFKWINIDTFFLLFAFMYVPAVLIMLWIDFANRGIKIVPKVSLLTKRIYKIILGYTTFHFSSTLLVFAPTAINSLLISSISTNGLRDTAVYVMAKFFVAVLDTPLRSIMGINVATLSESFQIKDFDKIGRIYKKTSINLLIAGVIFFILIYTNIDSVNLFFEDKDYSYLRPLFLILGLSKLFELSMGMNSTILYLSKYWKTDFYTSTFVVLFSIPVSYLLIKESPLLGAVLGEALMLVLICLLRLYWVNRLLQIQPYTHKTIGILVIGILCFGIVSLLPILSNIYMDVAMRSLVASVCFLTAIWFYKPSEDLHELMLNFVIKIKR